MHSDDRYMAVNVAKTVALLAGVAVALVFVSLMLA